MTPVKPDERRRVIGLLIAIAIVFGYAGYQILPNLLPKSGAVMVAGSRPQSQADTAGQAGKETAAPPSTATTTQTPAPRRVATADQPVLPPDLRSNPFRPVTSRPRPTVVTPPPAPVPMPAPPPNRVIITPAPTPGGAAAPPNPVPRPRTVAPQPSAAARPTRAERDLQLVGVVAGASSIAMIRAGSQEYFVGVGDKVGDYEVRRISAEKVTLVRGGKTRVLHVGGPPSSG